MMNNYAYVKYYTDKQTTGWAIISFKKIKELTYEYFKETTGIDGVLIITDIMILKWWWEFWK